MQRHSVFLLHICIGSCNGNYRTYSRGPGFIKGKFVCTAVLCRGPLRAPCSPSRGGGRPPSRGAESTPARHLLDELLGGKRAQ
jgi:hypothetical protein